MPVSLGNENSVIMTASKTGLGELGQGREIRRRNWTPQPFNSTATFIFLGWILWSLHLASSRLHSYSRASLQSCSLALSLPLFESNSFGPMELKAVCTLREEEELSSFWWPKLVARVAGWPSRGLVGDLYLHRHLLGFVCLSPNHSPTGRGHCHCGKWRKTAFAATH